MKVKPKIKFPINGHMVINYTDRLILFEQAVKLESLFLYQHFFVISWNIVQEISGKNLMNELALCHVEYSLIFSIVM